MEHALAEFDAAETTLRRLETVWQRLSELVPTGIAFIGGSPEGVQHDDLRRAFRGLAEGLPAIDGMRITQLPEALNEIAQARFDAQDIGEVEAVIAVEEGITAPGEELREYRFRFNRSRRALVREHVKGRLTEIDGLIAQLYRSVERDNTPLADSRWDALVEAVREVERLMGSSVQRKGRWRELARHLAWGQGCDLHDIAEHDWPSVLNDIEAALYDEFEPIPVTVADLADLAAQRPSGPISTSLAWEVLDDEAFERLLFNIISDAAGYENPRWLTKTRAPDRGRDMSVDRVRVDSLGGVTREHVVVQCRHWLTKSLAPNDIGAAANAMKLCEPPPVDVLVIATSGRFSGDAESWIDAHNHERQRLRVEPWAENHLESLLAQRPHLVEQFGLRPAE